MTSKDYSQARKRLLNDLKRFQETDDENESILATPHEDNLFIWDCIIFGPDDTQWEGGCFKLQMTFSEKYPKEAPKVLMKTKVFHPNFYVTGAICIDILQSMWSPIYDVHAILTSIQSLLTDPNPLSPANTEAAKLYQEDIQSYYTRVRECVEASMKDEEEED